jgi:hypothetical protein
MCIVLVVTLPTRTRMLFGVCLALGEASAGEKVLRPEWQELLFHTEVQDTGSDVWKSLEAYVAKICDEGSDELNPMRGIGSEKWEQIVTLPKSIGTLKSVKVLSLYGSHLVRIPPEIGDMTNLEEFDPYTSRCLHWFPFEITRCQRLTRSRVSTRCLYGNYKYRPPFPRLPQISAVIAPATCSVCGGPLLRREIHQSWISLRVATDVLPLLVHACSESASKAYQSPPSVTYSGRISADCISNSRQLISQNRVNPVLGHSTPGKSDNRTSSF